MPDLQGPTRPKDDAEDVPRLWAEIRQLETTDVLQVMPEAALA